MVQDTLKQKILNLRTQNKTYNEIISILKCSKGTVSYYLGKDQKTKTNNRQKLYRNRNINVKLCQKITTFKSKINKNYDYKNKFTKLRMVLNWKVYNFKRKNNNLMDDFTTDDLLKKIGDNPTCYLTGRPINLLKTREYHLDHIIPTAKGGKNTLDNLGLACKEANFAKNDLLLEDFIKLCKDVLTNNGYKVEKN